MGVRIATAALALAGVLLSSRAAPAAVLTPVTWS